MSISTGRRWYVVHTQPCAEAKAVRNLVRQGFEVYLPRYLKRRRHARKVESVAAPLFPRYLFVAFDRSGQRWHSIHSTVGVARLMCNGDEPAPVADDVVNTLMAGEDDRGLIRLPARCLFAVGDKVRLMEGAFLDCVALFEEMRDSERISVLLDLLGRKVRLVVPTTLVAPA